MIVVVVDASAVVELLLNTAAGAAVADRVFGSEDAAAPELLDIEVLQVLRRYARSGDLDARRGGEAVQDLAALPVERFSHEPLLVRVWALRENLSAYDATYVALAEVLDAVLITRDRALASASGHRARIELL